MRTVDRALFVLAAVLSASRASAEVRYVDDSASGAGDGESWADAFHSFDDALDAALPGDEVWVAAGTYPVPSNAGFVAPPGVSLYGGFAGFEAALEERDVGAHVSRLTGFHPARGVVVLTLVDPLAGTVVDGFKLDGTLTSQPHAGGGMIVDGGVLTVRNCWFFDNIAGSAAGALVRDAHVTFEDCFFDRNWSQVGDGGGIRATGAGSLTVERCRFVGNLCRELNGVPGRGAGLYNGPGSVLRVSECVFDDNWAYNLGHQFIAAGGGIANESPDARVERCLFIRNEASLGGGLYSSAPITLVSCLFTGNRGSEPASSTPFDTGEGGGIYGESGVSLTVKSCTIVANWSKHTAAGASMDGTLENCLLWQNVAMVEPGDNPEDLVDQQYEGDPLVRFCDIAGLFDDGDPGFDGAFAQDPLFLVAPILTNTGQFTAGDLRLAAGSPCLDAGDNGAVPAGAVRDLAGGLRFFDDRGAPDVGLGSAPLVDIGAYERVTTSRPVRRR